MPKLEFLNVDLDLLLPKQPVALLRDLGRKVLVLHQGQERRGYFVCLELGRDPISPEKALRRWLKLLDDLSPAGRRELLAATKITFNVGFDISSTGKACEINLPRELIAPLARWKAGYAVTLYQPDQFSDLKRPATPTKT